MTRRRGEIKRRFHKNKDKSGGVRAAEMGLLPGISLPPSDSLFLSLYSSISPLFFQTLAPLSIFCLAPRARRQSAGTNTGHGRDVSAHGGKALWRRGSFAYIIHAPRARLWPLH